jgi:hypothetical protein
MAEMKSTNRAQLVESSSIKSKPVPASHASSEVGNSKIFDLTAGDNPHDTHTINAPAILSNLARKGAVD